MDRFDEDHCRDSSSAEEAGVRLTRLVAESRQARVFAVDSRDGTAILKVAAEATMADRVGRSRFAREGSVGLALRHPHIVETLRCGEGWILSKNVNALGAHAPSLLDHVRKEGPLAIAEVERFTREIGEALAYMHARGFVHRDIKPGNILIANDGRFVVIDLGVVGFAADHRLDASELVGSPAWMAPEQIEGARAHASADVWSLAAVAAFALCGRSAYEGTANAVLHRRKSERNAARRIDERILVRASLPLRELIVAGLSADARSRPPTRAFAQLESGCGVSAAGSSNLL